MYEWKIKHLNKLYPGTQKGRVYVFDHLGNKIVGNNIPPHAIDVNQISVDRSGEWLASCANDGKIVIYAVCDTLPDNAQVRFKHQPPSYLSS